MADPRGPVVVAAMPETPPMNRLIGFAYATAIVAFQSSAADADAPKINDIRPYGVKRGEPAEVTINGSGLAGSPVFVAPFPLAIEVLPNSDGGNFRVKVTVPASIGLGVYPVRVKTDDGISNPFLLAVGQVAAVNEVEDNSTFEQAQAVPSPTYVEGTCAGSDVDYFKFPGKKGQKIVIDAQCARVGSGVDPQIRLTTAARKFVESADDTPGLITDARLVAVLPEDGEYVVELSDSKYAGGGRPVYRLMIGEIPVAGEVYPLGGRRGETVGYELRGGTLNETTTMAATLLASPFADILYPKLAIGGGLDAEIPAPLELSDLPELRESSQPTAPPVKGVAPVVFNGRIDPAGDEDRFTLAVTPGQTLRIRVDASEQGSALDGTLQILGANNAVLAAAEDSVAPAAATRGQRRAPGINSPDPALDFVVPAGVTEITLALKDLIGRGGIGFPYRIAIEPATPGFSVSLNDSQISVPKGGSAAVGVTVQRQGFNGPIVLTILDPPAGLSMRPLTIPDGGVAGLFTVSLSKDAVAFGPLDLKVIGKADTPAGPITEMASKTLVLAQQGTLPTNSVTQTGLASASALALPASLDSPATPVESVHGGSGIVPLTVARGEGADGALAIASLPLPVGMSVAGTIAEKVNEGPATINTPIESPLGPISVVFTGKGKLAGKDVTLTAPSVLVNVVRPANLELAMPAVEVKGGTTFELKGKVVRNAAFKEPVKLTLNGLPAGLKADAIDLAPDASEFTFKIQADAGAAEAMANAQVALAFKIGGKDYPYPPAALGVKVIK